MDSELNQKIDELGRKIDENTRRVNQLRRYFLWTLIISIAVIVLPIIGLIFMIPQFLSALGSYQSLGF